MLILVTTYDFFLFKDFERIAFTSVLLLYEEYFTVRSFADDTDLVKVFCGNARCLLNVVSDKFLIFLDLFLSLNNLHVRTQISLLLAFVLRG